MQQSTSVTIAFVVDNPLIQIINAPTSFAWKVGTPITSVQFQATGGGGSYFWSMSGGPAGVTISASGLLSGTPTTAATGTITIFVHDS